MALNSGFKRRFFRIKSSDSESDVPLYKRERITRAKRVTKSLQTICDNDSSVHTSTDNISAKRCSNAINKNCNRSIRPSAVYRTRIVSTSSESDTTTVDDHKITRAKQLKKRKSNVDTVHVSESSWNSTESLIENKKKFLRSSNANKQNNNKDCDSEFIDCSQVVEDRSKKTNDKQSNIVASTPIGDNQAVEKQKQDVSSNFKPHVTKIMEEMKCKFARFISQISRLQQRYFKEETVNLEDAKDIIFILTCIISRLKEEFTEHQHKLMDFCFESSMKHNSKRTVSNIQDKQFLNDNHLQVQSLIHSSPNSWDTSSSNNDEPLFSQNTHVERLLQATKSSTNNVQLSNKDSVSHKTKKKNNTKSALKTNNRLISVQTNEDNVVVQNNKSTLSIPDNITKSNMKGNIKDSTRNTSKTKDSPKTSTFPFRQPTKVTQNLSKHILISDDNMSQHASSDVDSTCSTLNLFSYEAKRQQKNRIVSSINEYGSKKKNDGLDKIAVSICDDDAERTSIYRVSSCENIFSDRESTKRSSISNNERCPASNNSTQTNSLCRIQSMDTMIFPSQTDNENIRGKSIYRFNSEETLIIPKRTSTNTKNCSFIKKMKRFSINNKNFTDEPDSEFIVPNAGNLYKKYRLKYTDDKKLQMNCRVIIERCNL